MTHKPTRPHITDMNDFLKRFVQKRGMSYCLLLIQLNTLMLNVSREDGGWAD